MIGPAGAVERSPPPRTPGRSSAWYRLGAGLGVLTALADRVAVRTARPEPDAGWGLAMATDLGAVVLSAGIYGLGFLAVWAFVRAAAAASIPLGRATLRVLVIAGLPVFLALHALSLMSQVLTGTFPDLTPILMFASSPAQFLREGTRGIGIRAVVPLVVAGVGVALVVRAYRYTKEKPWTWPLGIQAVASALLLVVVLTDPPLASGQALWDRLATSTPELTLLASGSQGPPAPSTGSQRAPDPEPEPGPMFRVEATDDADVDGSVRSGGGERPNVLIVMLESVGTAAIHAAGYARPVTPNIDELWASGLVHPRTIASSTQSNYAQMAILSSLVPIRRFQLDTYDQLDYPRVLWNDTLHDLGYDTATISSQNENWQGMARFEATHKPHHFFDSRTMLGSGGGTTDEEKLHDDVTVDEALRWLGTARRPFGLYVNLQATHFPYEPNGFPRVYRPDEVSSNFNFLAWTEADRAVARNRYDNALLHVDAQVGRLLRWLDSTGERGRTVVVLVSDHGEMFGEEGTVTHGKSLHPLQILTPSVIVAPGILREPHVSEMAVSALDVWPTVLEAIGAPPHPAHQGISFLDETRYAAERPAALTRLQGLRFMDGVTCWPWLAVADYSKRSWGLYNLEGPAKASRDLSASQGRIASSLFSLLRGAVAAQIRYHNGPGGGNGTGRYAPRHPRCPDEATSSPR